MCKLEKETNTLDQLTVTFKNAKQFTINGLTLF